MSDPIVITRELVKRGWSDFEPKLITGLLSGGVSTFITSILGQYGIHLDATMQKIIVVGCFFLGGYLTPSTGTAVTKRIDNGIREVEQHTGSTVTTVTGPTPVQTPSAFTAVVTGDTPPATPDSTPTVQYSRGASILDQLPSAKDN